jgi:hypothetical protein
MNIYYPCMNILPVNVCYVMCTGYTKRSSSWFCSRLQMIGFHHTDEFLLFSILILDMAVVSEPSTV